MNTSRFACLCLVGLTLLGPATLAAQSDRPHRGKIDGVERDARRSGGNGNNNDSDDDDDAPWFVQIIFGLFHSGDHEKGTEPLPPTPGRGYQDYPYADTAESDGFLREHVLRGRGFGAVSGTYFNDNAVGGTLQAGQVAWEGAQQEFYASLEYSLYREPTQTDVDWLHSFRAEVGGLPRLGHLGFARIGGGVRVLVLDNGVPAVGPELEVGAELMPRRPWGVGGSARGALVHWNGGGTRGMADLSAHASWFLNRFELMAGWRYVAIGSAPAFNGPTAGLRVWF
jgi:hypothetical protein